MKNIYDDYQDDAELTLEEFAEAYGIQFLTQPIANTMEIKKDVLECITPQNAQKYKMLPWQITTDDNNEKTLHIITSNEKILQYQQEILGLTGEKAEKLNFIMISEPFLAEAIANFYNLSYQTQDYAEAEELEIIRDRLGENDDTDVDDDSEELATDSSSPIVALVNTIIRSAVQKKASDIHFEPEESGMIVKFRIDGILLVQKNFYISEKNKKAVIARIKIMSSLDVSSRKDTQDGQIKLRINDNEIDFRVSFLPITNGEKCVIRILDKSTSLLELESLGFDEKDISIFNRVINKPTGIVLITGPTGSGKSTTLYSFLKRLDSTSKNITTIENPVEYQLKGINQVQVDPTGKYVTFAKALREILRQDPNVIMIGEIRDPDTAENAVQAAQTGHLVFSTLHTNDAISVITRLKRLGIEPDAITQSLTCVMAQRLVRRICKNCMEEYMPDFKKLDFEKEQMDILNAPSEAELAEGTTTHHFYHGVGCDECNHTGYKGRITVYEYYVMTDELRMRIERGDSIYDIKKYLINDMGYKRMWDKAIELVKNNITTVEEIYSEVNES